MKNVTAIIVSFNSEQHLTDCLASLQGQQKISVELIVVDNDSSDRSRSLVKKLSPTATLVANESNRGFAAAVNQGLSLASNEFVLLLNPDAVLLEDSLERMLRFAEMHPEAAAIGPRQWLDSACRWQWSIVPWPPYWWSLLSGLRGFRTLGLARTKLSHRWSLNRSIWSGNTAKLAPYLSGACMLLRREALEEIGGFDQGYFLFYEDVDICQRLRAAGWSLYALPSAGVVHRGLGSVSDLPHSGRVHLTTAGRRYLSLHGDKLSQVLWFLLSLRRNRKAGTPEMDTAVQSSIGTLFSVLRWTPVRDAIAYQVEVGLEPTFSYAVAAEVECPECNIPTNLAPLMSDASICWRFAPIFTGGRFGPYSRPQPVRFEL